MPKQRSGEFSLPNGWEEGLDHDGKVFFIDHNTQKTTWVDPRDRITKPPTFADCVGDELPVGWEEAWDPNVGRYFIDHVNRLNQLEDPRLQYRQHQENMLQEYLVTANEDLAAKKEIYTIKQQRLALAQDECSHLRDTLTGSAVSLNSITSCGSKHDPDLLRADVALAKNRVSRLKREIEQVRTEMQYKERGLETLTQVSEKMLGQQSIYSVNEARAILEEIFKIKQSLSSGEKEKKDLLQSLAKLKDDFLVSKFKSESSIDVSIYDKSNAESQTDLSGEMVPIGQRLAEMTKMRLEYDEARQQVAALQQKLTGIEEQMVPGQADSDKDRLLLIQEKEQLLRELRGIGRKGRSPKELETIGGQIHQLERDLSQAVETSNRQIANRLKLQDDKCSLVQSLAQATRRTSLLESQLRSLSLSTLSMSSGSSLGSLGSLSASSSKGSLNSLSFTDIYSQTQYGSGASDINLQDLHQRVEKLLQGHSVSPIHEGHAGAGSIDNISSAVGQYGAYDSRLHTENLLQALSPGSSFSSLSPPISPYDVGPPPSYEQHMNLTNKRQLIKSSSSSSIDQNLQARLSDLNLLGECSHSVCSSTSSAVQPRVPPVPPLPVGDTADLNPLSVVGRPRAGYADSIPEGIGNPPLSPISETVVCNGVSNVVNRSVSAAVSDESVAGDSGVFEASVKRASEGEEVYECSQIQLKLKYDGDTGDLHISIEQGRRLSCLGLPENSSLHVEGVLLPDSILSFKTQALAETNSPKLSESFKLSIVENKLHSKTLQINVMATCDKTVERVGWFQVSLAEFADFDPKPHWYNVLSTKYVQAEQKSSSCSSRGSISTSSTSQSSPMNGSDHVTSLLEASSARLRKDLPDEKSSTSTETKSFKPRSPSLEATLFKNVSSVKEESSDESTIISSQTSTLTRSQGPDSLEFHKEGTPVSVQGFSEGLSSSLDDEDGDLLNFQVPQINVQSGGSDNDDEDGCDDDELITCDKETNTEGNFGHTHARRRSHGNRNCSVRRSQTFSPADRPLDSGDYVCKLNRSDSDSSMPLYRKPFQRNSLERRSLRWKRRNLPKAKTSEQGLRTSLDLELDLHASRSKLVLQQDEISRLRDLKKRMEEAKAKGDAELPSWFSDNEPLQMLLTEAESLAKKQTKSITRHDRRAEHLLNKALKQAHKQRCQPKGEGDMLRFREKMAFFTNVTLQVPVIPLESDDDDDDGKSDDVDHDDDDSDTPRNSRVIE